MTFFIGSALAGAAGVVQGMYFGAIAVNFGFQAGLEAFTAAVKALRPAWKPKVKLLDGAEVHALDDARGPAPTRMKRSGRSCD